MKVTLVSIIPFPLEIVKPTVNPGNFVFTACERGELQILQLTDAFCYIFMDGDRGHLKQVIPAEQLAQSIIMDYRDASLETTHDTYPGMFWVEGHHGEEGIRKAFAKELDQAVKAQDKWLNKLVLQADDTWQKYHQHRAVTGLARTAAKHLGLERSWKIDSVSASVPCSACSNPVFETAVVCPSCNFVIDEARFATMKFAGNDNHVANASLRASK